MVKNEIDEIGTSLKLLVKFFFVVLFGVFISKVLTYLYRIFIVRDLGLEAYGMFFLDYIYNINFFIYFIIRSKSWAIKIYSYV